MLGKTMRRALDWMLEIDADLLVGVGVSLLFLLALALWSAVFSGLLALSVMFLRYATGAS